MTTDLSNTLSTSVGNIEIPQSPTTDPQPVTAAASAKAKLAATSRKSSKVKPYNAVKSVGSKPIKTKAAKPELNAVGRAHAAKAAAKAKAVKALKTSPKTKPISKPKDQGGSSVGSSKEAICSMCHKPLSRHSSVENGMGDVCAAKVKLLPAGMTMEDHYASITQDEIPNGYIKLADAIKKANTKGVSTYRFVQAMGGERMLRKPINQFFKVVMVGHTRYINAECLKHLADLKKV